MSSIKSFPLTTLRVILYTPAHAHMYFLVILCVRQLGGTLRSVGCRGSRVGRRCL